MAESANGGVRRWRSDAKRWTCERAESPRYWAFASEAAVEDADGDADGGAD